MITPSSKISYVTDQGTYLKILIYVEFHLDKVKLTNDISSDSHNSGECSIIEGIMVQRKMRIQSKEQTQSCDGSPYKKYMQIKCSWEYYISQDS